MDHGNYGSGGGYGQGNQYGASGGHAPSGGYGGNQGGYSNNQGGYSNNQGGYGNNQGGYGNNQGDRYGGGDAAYGGRNEYRNDLEMQQNPQVGYGNSNSNRGNSGDRILDECTAIDELISDLESRFNSFKALTTRILSDRAQVSELEAASSDIVNTYRNATDRMKRIKSNPESGSPRNAPQVGRVDRRLKTSWQQFKVIEADFRAKMKEQQTRQYRIVNPEATEDEVRQAVEDPNTQVFQQALMNADRRGQSQSALNAVRQRHAAIQNIEQTMIELGQLFQDMDNLVLSQDTQVKEIEEKGIEVQENIVQGNKELDHGIKSARGARKKKWILCGIVVVLLLIIIIVVLIWFFIIRQQAKTVTGH